MPTKEELGQLSLTKLAGLCGKVAKRAYAGAEMKEKASQLKQEAKMLLVGQPHPVLAEQKQAEVAMEELKTRMAEFLAGTL